ncbi:hypothetical protein TanjilG_15315 [Lupinus angustifolius]|uniref:Methyltransferase type 12 domain-containing protein n=1 Tax=Lupinus angustifolius TaxID=3871 RepID=A0A1J7IH04_LUPAN|nr:hypothetical protein TanjilG_15315 [Lupinus angustifolius]
MVVGLPYIREPRQLCEECISSKFFKDRHYLDKYWGDYFSVGCGAGNTIFPVIASYPDAFIYACDFSPQAIELVKTNEDFKESHVNAFVSDLTADDLCKEILPSSVDIVTMPNGYVLLRDYAFGDFAQEKFSGKGQKISDNFYVRGDGTRAYYFSNEFLTNLFKENGFDVHKLDVCCKQVENRSRELVMNRRWVQAVFRVSDSSNCSSSKEAETNHLESDNNDEEIKQNSLNGGLIDSAIDLSEGVAFNMFGISPSSQYEGQPVTNIAEAILPLFATAKELIASFGNGNDNNVPALILCHIFRCVDEPTLLSAAAQLGFRLVDKWAAEVSANLPENIVRNWFLDNHLEDDLPSTALNILLFHLE